MMAQGAPSPADLMVLMADVRSVVRSFAELATKIETKAED